MERDMARELTESCLAHGSEDCSVFRQVRRRIGGSVLTGHAPDFLTIDEARAVLGFGRTMAYREAAIYVASGGENGAMPAIELKPGVLRVPRIALEELLGGPLTWPPPRQETSASVTKIEPDMARPTSSRKKRQSKNRGTDQSTLPFSA